MSEPTLWIEAVLNAIHSYRERSVHCSEQANARNLTRTIRQITALAVDYPFKESKARLTGEESVNSGIVDNFNFKACFAGHVLGECVRCLPGSDAAKAEALINTALSRYRQSLAIAAVKAKSAPAEPAALGRDARLKEAVAASGLKTGAFYRTVVGVNKQRVSEWRTGKLSPDHEASVAIEGAISRYGPIRTVRTTKKQDISRS